MNNFADKRARERQSVETEKSHIIYIHVRKLIMTAVMRIIKKACNFPHGRGLLRNNLIMGDAERGWLRL